MSNLPDSSAGRFFEVHPDAGKTVMKNTPMAQEGTVGQVWIPRKKVKTAYADAEDPEGTLVVTKDGIRLHIKCKPDDFVAWMQADPEKN
jgi:hypothetical protein